MAHQFTASAVTVRGALAEALTANGATPDLSRTLNAPAVQTAILGALPTFEGVEIKRKAKAMRDEAAAKRLEAARLETDAERMDPTPEPPDGEL